MPPAITTGMTEDLYQELIDWVQRTENATTNTPLAPSVEKAYYRKCIQLKRRLTEVEQANDEAKIRRQRLDRGIMKMRLERAFLLDELRKRMEYVEESGASGDEGVATVRFRQGSGERVVS